MKNMENKQGYREKNILITPNFQLPEIKLLYQAESSCNSPG
ncbi:hypothetical protein LEP1GSC192_1216 [Leptospira sp. B5-022]|nr:hypothetical protein LEP1GSC192_1216 [Leptospira sp. B5-022]